MSEINNEILSKKKKLLSLRVKNSSGELKNTSEIKKAKKEIARLFTKQNKMEAKA
ncbi:MAG: 50S ribosomal protein L29 [Rickettsiales bacterium]|jgi:ribosomal protein L29|nr:50S ribosomal protein L29 [Rickettsiales bacterium]